MSFVGMADAPGTSHTPHAGSPLDRATPEDAGERTHPASKRGRTGRNRFNPRRLFLWCAGTLVLYLAWQTFSINRYGFRDDGQSADCAIVLGGAAAQFLLAELVLRWFFVPGEPKGLRRFVRDAHIFALGGAWLGPGGIAAAMALAVVSGALVGSTARLSGRLGPREPFPFGPFIALGIWLVWLTGPQWWWSTWLMLLGA